MPGLPQFDDSGDEKRQIGDLKKKPTLAYVST
jgi:hypothetical protein